MACEGSTPAARSGCRGRPVTDGAARLSGRGLSPRDSSGTGVTAPARFPSAHRLSARLSGASPIRQGNLNMSFDHRKYRRSPSSVWRIASGPNRVLAGAALVRRGPARWQPGAGRAHDGGPEDADVGADGFYRLQAHRVGFPAASQPDFDFVRELIDHNLIPDDVTIQVLVQARESDCPYLPRALKGRGGPSSTSTTRSADPAQLCVPTLGAKGQAIAVQGRAGCGEYAARNPGTSGASVLAGELQQHRWVCRRGVRRRHRRVARRCRPMILNLPPRWR